MITINTDASFCGKTKAGGYAFWIKGEKLAIKSSGGFKEDLLNSSDAEMKCIINAIASVLKRKHLLNCETIVINTDSKHCISAYKTPLRPLDITMQRYINQLKEKVKAQNVILKHVKAHSGAKDSRRWVNEWCDENAKRHMRIIRKNKYLGK